MGKLGKILAPIAAVLAIALAVASFFIYKGFQNYQKRAANLAEFPSGTRKRVQAAPRPNVFHAKRILHENGGRVRREQ